MTRQSVHAGKKSHMHDSIASVEALGESSAGKIPLHVYCVTMFSTLPQSVRDEGWQAWESQRMQQEDLNAPPPPTTHEASDSEMSCLSAADSSTARRRKLDGMVYGMTLSQVDHLRGIKRKAQKAAHNAPCRGKSRTMHLENVLGDISAVLSWQTHQTRETNGKFGRLDIH